MKRSLMRFLAAAGLAAVLGMPARAAQLLIPVGRVVGLSLSDGTVTVAAFHETYGSAAREAGLQIGDEIISIDGRAVDSAQGLHDALARSGGTVTVTVCRDGKSRALRLSPAITAEGPRLGVYIREGISGIGTVTYYDPDSGSFGALGHSISRGQGGPAAMEEGRVYPAAVRSVRRGLAGEPGQLKGAVESGRVLGTLTANTPYGVFGTGAEWPGVALPAAQADEVSPGKAMILSNVTGEQVDFYDVEILKCYHRQTAAGRDMLLQITDPDLLEATGGIVAGMSGSPIIQDGKLVGAVTHVLVNDPTRGYGIFIENMLEAAE